MVLFTRLGLCEVDTASNIPSFQLTELESILCYLTLPHRGASFQAANPALRSTLRGSYRHNCLALPRTDGFLFPFLKTAQPDPMQAPTPI
ncbi:hypothetical protein VTJ04DRAFT_2679 [Mycothermus thermophilus]|uniref:uncharacterized protein n=1 Tax=Humicola insolens TaxID=85995 RepID=UPI0037449A61